MVYVSRGQNYGDPMVLESGYAISKVYSYPLEIGDKYSGNIRTSCIQ